MKFFASAFLLLVALPSVDAEVNSTPGAQEPSLYIFGDLSAYLNSPDPELLLEEARMMIAITRTDREWGEFMGSIDGEQCRKSGVHVGSIADRMLGRVHLFCCLDCSSYATESGGLAILTMKGMRHFANAAVDEEMQASEAASHGCVNLQGNLEIDPFSTACLFRVDIDGTYGGSLSSFSPLGNESFETVIAEYGCIQMLSANNYELSCFCRPENATDCEYSKGYHNQVIKHQNRLMLEAAKQNRNRMQTSALKLFHRNEYGNRKVHCAYGRLATSMAGVETNPRYWSEVFDGFYSRKNLRREDLPPPRSSCGIKVTFNALDYEKSIYNMTIDMGSFTECDMSVYYLAHHYWVPVQPTCPLHVSEKDDITLLRCCRGSDACNHVAHAEILGGHNLFQISRAYTNFGIHFPWAHACGDTLAPYLYLMEGGTVLCDYIYDLQKGRVVKEYEYTPLKWYRKSLQKVPMEGLLFNCFRYTVILSKLRDCPVHLTTFDESDSPLRDYIICRDITQYKDGDNVHKLPEKTLNTLFARTMEKADFRCIKEEMALDKFISRSDQDVNMTFTTQSSNYSACFIKLSIYEDSSNFRITAGAVSEDDDGIFDFYADHFVSQQLVDGVALALNATERSATLICSGSSKCNSNVKFLELLLALFQLNTVDSDFARPMVCGRKKCPDYSGCYHLRTYGDETTEEEGCIADIKPEDEHLSMCFGKSFKRSKHLCDDLRILKDGIPKFHRVCCHSYGGPKFLEDLGKPFTWPMDYE